MIWNPTYILKKDTYIFYFYFKKGICILHKNMYIFLVGNHVPLDPIKECMHFNKYKKN